MAEDSHEVDGPGQPPRSRRDQVLDQAARQLNSQGMSQSSLADLAASLGFTRNALYHYMEDFSDLLAQVYRRSCALLDERMDAAMGAGSSLAVLQRFVALALDGALPEIAALNEYGLLRPDDRAEVGELYNVTEARLALVVADGVAARELRACNPTLVARTVINLIHWAPLAARRGLAVGAHERAQAVATISDLLAEGWAADRTAAIAPPEIDLTPLLVRVADGFDQAALHAVRRESMLSCASRMFNSRGVDLTSMDELAGALGTTKPRLYKYVGDKKTLVDACFARADRINRFILDAARTLPCGPMEMLVALLRTSAAVRLSWVLEPMRYAVADSEHGPIDKGLVNRRNTRMVEYNAQMFLEGQRLGVVRPFDLQGLRLVNMTAGGGMVRPSPDLSPAVFATAAEMVEILRIGLRPL